jgi:hypothetical protein
MRFALALGLVLVLATGGVMTASTAEQQALNAEREHITNRLDDATCLDEWGVDAGTVRKSARVTGVTARGVRVRVTMPYAYRVEQDGEPLFADTASDATYVVSLRGAHRMSGDRIEPC